MSKKVHTSNKTDYNAKVKDIEDKIPSSTGLATTAAATAVKNGIPAVYDIYSEIKNIYILHQLIIMNS